MTKPLLPGYRELDTLTVQLLTDIKTHETRTAALVALTRAHIEDSTGVSGAQLPPGHPTSEQLRQLAIARTEFEGAFMRLCRAVAGPISPWDADAAPPAQNSHEAARQFLMTITAMVNRHENIPAPMIVRLKALADWADVPPPPRWDGSYNRAEILRAVQDAYARLDRPARPARPAHDSKDAAHGA